ncbi:hypothetical protein K402DRAFT_455721 [Aulographum hederae CBS 113979]|uniref:DUF6546 domain-containing protein n=1 Tax=Aulographum hederae CBS 113979 TaxID=1176131 RepID=A0A6G1GUW5_9PEZI|nr:hypothetical protein K402DRAFT_455721 [Aulographum hederae CBS 113979]
MTSWNRILAEIRLMVLETVIYDSCNLASIATVSREWQTVIEQQNFSRIKLTPSRLPEFGAMIHRNRRLVRYILFCLELEEYDCTGCEPQDPESRGLSEMDNSLIVKGFENLFSILSAWQPGGELTLDISVYSPSDSQHRFNYLTFESDTTSDTCDEHRLAERPMLSNPCENYQGLSAGARQSRAAINKVFEEIMGESPFDDDEQERRWWQQLPLVPAVTGVLLRQQTRRRWKPDALVQMFARMPGLREIHYEPWREWIDILQRWTDKDPGAVLEVADLKSLALTSRLLRSGENPTKLDDMLQAAVATAMEMPNLETMELWNGLEELAMLVKYRRARLRRPAAIEWKGTWEMTLRDPVIEAWDAVASRHGGGACVADGKLVAADPPIRSHGDAIRLLGLSNSVIRPVSLRQILREHTIRKDREDQ